MQGLMGSCDEGRMCGLLRIKVKGWQCVRAWGVDGRP